MNAVGLASRPGPSWPGTALLWTFAVVVTMAAGGQRTRVVSVLI
jgi:hypothetical protein